MSVFGNVSALFRRADVPPPALVADVEVPSLPAVQVAASIAPEPVQAPRRKRAAKAARVPKAPKVAPRAGTVARGVFDMLSRPEGATRKELAAAGFAKRSVAADAKAFAARYGLDYRIEKDGRFHRARLVPKAATH